jgi:hypothetical protein
MNKTEALKLAAQLGLVLPKTKCADALFDLCEKLDYKLGLEEVMENGQAVDSAWVIWDANNKEIARCD